MKSIVTLCFFVLASITSSNASTETFCEAWFQLPGGSLEKTTMNVFETTERGVTYEASVNGYDFRVNWDFELTTFYILIDHDGKNVLGTTARVPTQNHPENFTDLSLPGGPRLSVNCEMK